VRQARNKVCLVIAPAGRRQASERHLLSDGVLDITVGACGEPVLLNAGGLGYYRVQYDEPTRRALAASFARWPRADRVTLLADGWALVAAEKMLPSDYFTLVESVPAEDVRAVWQSGCGPNWCWTRWRWRSASGGRTASSIQRPGQPIHIVGARQTLQGGWSPAVNGLGRRCLRQRHVRELLRHARMRTAGAT
jgi:hypothetical protein